MSPHETIFQCMSIEKFENLLDL